MYGNVTPVVFFYTYCILLLCQWHRNVFRMGGHANFRDGKETGELHFLNHQSVGNQLFRHVLDPQHISTCLEWF